MNNGLYHINIPSVEGMSRLDTVFRYLELTLFNGVQELSLDSFGAWALSVFNHYSPDNFDIVFEVVNDNVVRFFYITENNTIKRIDY